MNDETPLTDLQVKDSIRSIVEHGTVIISGHAKTRMKERGYTSPDIEHILLYGEVTRKEQDHNGVWRYTIRGDDLDGDEGAVVTVIVTPTSAVIVTVLG